MRLIFFPLLLITFLLPQLQSVQAQIIPKVGSYWNYTATLPTGPFFMFTDYVVADSTAPDGSRILSIEDHRTGYGISSLVYKTMEFRNDSVFYNGVFYFDYSASVGDTIKNNPSSIYYVVDSISNIMIGADTVKKISTKKYHTYNSTFFADIFCQNVDFAEIIGPLNHSIYIWYVDQGATNPCTEGDWTIYPYFQCFRLDSLVKYPSGSICQPLIFHNSNVNINQIESISNKISVYPNPFIQQTTFNINSSSNYTTLNLQLIDLTGRIVKELTNVSTYSISLPRGELEKGLYFYKVIGDNQLLGTGKIMVLD